MQSQHLSGHESVLLVVVLVFWIQTASAGFVDWHLSQVVCAVQRFQEFQSRTSGKSPANRPGWFWMLAGAGFFLLWPVAIWSAGEITQN